MATTIALVQLILGLGLLHRYLNLSKRYKNKLIEANKLEKDKRICLVEYKQLDFKYAAVSNRLVELKRKIERLEMELEKANKKTKKR